MIYLDNSATTRCFPSAAKVVEAQLTEQYYNVSSPYGAALKNEKLLQKAEKFIAGFFGCDPKELIFTSGGTESDNTALFSAFTPDCELIVSAAEHHAILHTALRLQEMGATILYAPVLENGCVDVDWIREHVTDKTAMVSIMHVNNETGALNDLTGICKAVKEKNPCTLVHSDGVQAFMHVCTDMNSLGVDLYSASGHKVHGPKGIGVLYLRKGTPFRPLLYGGGQQDNLRSGTVNTPGILGLAAALGELKSAEDFSRRLSSLKAAYVDRLLAIPDARLNGTLENSAPNVLSVAFRGVKAATLQNAMEEQVILGKGSACTSRSSKLSHVLEAMGVPREWAEGTVRLSFGAFNTQDEVDEVCDLIREKVQYLRKYQRK